MPRNRRPGRTALPDAATSSRSQIARFATRAGAVPPAVLMRMAAWRSPEFQTAALAGGAYAALILVMWGLFGLYSGFFAETGFPFLSETSSVLKGFLYPLDPLRIQMMTFFQLPYLIGEALGIRGSYVPYQVIYAALWWARGFLSFLILRKFLPGSLSICYAAGALVVVHASDSAFGWVGPMNQLGSIFWMVLAFYLLLLAAEAVKWPHTALFVAGACLFEYMSLWSYESQLLLVLVLPVGLVFRWRCWRKLAVLGGAWYLIPAVYIRLTFLRYVGSTARGYQESVMRKAWSVGSLLRDWVFNIKASLEFWDWPRGDWKPPKVEIYLLSLAASIVFVACGLAFLRLTREYGRPSPFVGRIRTWWTLLGAGFILLALSFPAFLLLEAADSLWRTQFLAGIGAGLVLAALCGLVSQAVPWRVGKIAVFLVFGGTVVFFGSESVVQKTAVHRWIWERHRTAISEVLKIAPSVQANTLVVFTNVPKGDDPFADDMWLDLALRLAYPGIPVGGVYYYADGTPGPNDRLRVRGRAWEWDGTGFPPLLRGAGLASTLVVRYEPGGTGKLVETLPPYLCDGECAAWLYRPLFLISAPVSPIAARRYRLD